MSKATTSPGHRAVPEIVVALGAAIALSATACTPPSKPSPTTPVSPAQASLSSTGRPANRTIKLSCTDANLSAQPPTGTRNQLIDGLTIEAATNELTGLAPADVGLRVPDGPPLYFAKAPLQLKSGTPKTTIKLTAASDGYLAWVPSRIWTGGSGPIDLTAWMATAVVLEGCPVQPSTYLGGLLSTSPHMCLTLQVSQAETNGKSHMVQLGPPEHC